MQLTLDDKQLATMRRHLASGKYQLLLGAGSNVGGTLKNGQEIPLGSRLTGILAEFASLGNVGNASLWSVYGEAVAREGKEKVAKYLSDLLRYANPPKWMERAARVGWGNVWTLNIDRAFETAFEKAIDPGLGKCVSLTGQSPFIDESALRVIHLHGVIDDDADSLIFSLAEYRREITTRHAPITVFEDYPGAYPFVVIGAAGDAEPDLTPILMGGGKYVGAPSFWIDPFMDEFKTRQVEGKGFIPFKGEAEEFFNELARLADIDFSSQPVLREFVDRTIGSQFDLLDKKPIPSQPSNHSIFLGDQPLWSDVLLGQCITLEWYRKLFQCLSDIGVDPDGPKSGLVVITGNRLSGRTTTLLKSAHKMIELGYEVLLFRSDRPNVEAINQYHARTGRPLALCFDGFAQFAQDIDKIIKLARGQDGRIVCIGVEGGYSQPNVLSRVKSSHLLGNGFYAAPKFLSIRDRGNLVYSLEKHGYLGEYSGLPKSELTPLIKDREIVDGLALFAGYSSWFERARTLFIGIDNEFDLRIILFSSMADQVGARLLIEDLARLLGIAVPALNERLADLPDHVVLHEGRVFSRLRFAGLPIVITQLGVERALVCLSEGVVRLGSRVDRRTQTAHTASADLVSGLMSAKHLRKQFNTSQLEPYYEALRPSFGQWSGRYWEQRAILLREDGSLRSLVRARSYAHVATTKRPDDFSYTTLLTVQLALLAKSENEINRRSLIDSLLDSLKKSLDFGGDTITCLAFMNYGRAAIDRVWTINKEEVNRLLDVWDDCYTFVRIRAASENSINQELNKYMQWRSKYYEKV